MSKMILQQNVAVYNSTIPENVAENICLVIMSGGLQLMSEEAEKETVFLASASGRLNLERFGRNYSLGLVVRDAATIISAL